MSLRRGDGSLDPDVVLAAYEERRGWRGPVVNMMHELLRTYNGEIALPLPELNASEHSLVANLVVQGVDAMGQRISSLMPDVRFAKLKDTRAERVASEDRRSATLTMWAENDMRAKMARRARHYVGHGATSVLLRPRVDDKLQPVESGVMWHLRRPFETFAAETTNDDDITPPNVIYCYDRTYGWLRSHYPEIAVDFHIPDITKANSKVEIVEYVDCYGTMLIARNMAEYMGYHGGYQRKLRILEDIYYDYGDVHPYTVVGRPTLGGKTMGMFDQNVPMFRMQAKLAALEVEAIRKGIFPDTWFVGSNNNEPRIIRWPDPVNGHPGVITDGTVVTINPQPSYMSPQMRSDLEYAQRMTARIPAEQGGQASSTVRTARRGADIISQTVDFPVQEAQDDFCRALEAENKAAATIQKYHFGRKTFSLYVGGDALKVQKDYRSQELWDSIKQVVKYPASGTDINSLSVMVMQMVGSEMISKDSARKTHPMIEDPELEKDMIVVEGLEKAVLAGIQTRAASPDPAQAIPIGDIMELIRLVKADKDELPDAWDKVQKKAQERQAQQAEAMSPETMPGAEVAGAGAEQMAAVPAPGPSLDNMASMFNRLRQPRGPQPMQQAG